MFVSMIVGLIVLVLLGVGLLFCYMVFSLSVLFCVCRCIMIC